MKKNILYTVLVFMYCSFVNSQNREWEDLSIFSINTEKPHATFYPFASEKLLLENGDIVQVTANVASGVNAVTSFTSI